MYRRSTKQQHAHAQAKIRAREDNERHDRSAATPLQPKQTQFPTDPLADELREFLEDKLPPGKTERAIYLANALLKAEDIHDLLAEKLPPGKTSEALYLTRAIIDAGLRYNHYTEKRNEWADYAVRKKQLNRLIKLLEKVGCALRDLDILSRDELEYRCHSVDLDKLVGSLTRLNDQTAAMIQEAQKAGRPRELADERWILDLADIYENAFCVSISDDLAKFRRFLEACRPTSFAKFGKLGHRQVKRTLELRKQNKRVVNGGPTAR